MANNYWKIKSWTENKELEGNDLSLNKNDDREITWIS